MNSKCNSNSNSSSINIDVLICVTLEFILCHIFNLSFAQFWGRGTQFNIFYYHRRHHYHHQWPISPPPPLAYVFIRTKNKLLSLYSVMTLIGFKGKSVFPIFLRLPLHLATVYSVIPRAYFIFLLLM